jgi:hypothetical protein
MYVLVKVVFLAATTVMVAAMLICHAYPRGLKHHMYLLVKVVFSGNNDCDGCCHGYPQGFKQP